jgi:hypothetical protein
MLKPDLDGTYVQQAINLNLKTEQYWVYCMRVFDDSGRVIREHWYNSDDSRYGSITPAPGTVADYVISIVRNQNQCR